MTYWQKAIKYMAIVFAICLIVSIIGGIMSAVGVVGGFIESDATVDTIKSYSVSQDITSLKIDINAADFNVAVGDEFAVESNLKELTVKESNGCLTIIEDKKWGRDYNKAVLTLYIPQNVVFQNAEVETGAGRVTVDSLSADKLNLELGAGEVKITELNATQKAEIDGGAGKISINSGSLNNLDFDMGVGELNLTSSILGNSELDCGVGEVNVNLTNTADGYKIYTSKGIGAVSIDGQSISDDSAYGDGENIIKLNCGVGSVKVDFE